MPDVVIGCLGIAFLLILFAAGVELAYAMGIVGFVGLAYLRSTHAALNFLSKDFFESFASYTFTVIPLFLLMGQVAFNSGMAEQLYKTARKFIGHVPGGLALATIVGATLFKAITTSSLATSATFSSVAIPEMDKYGYGRKLSTGVVASVGTLGFLIPPAGSMIIMAMLTDQSIGRLFIAGAVPGIIIALLFVLVVVGWCKANPELGPRGPVFSWGERMKSVPEVFWPLLIFAVVIGGLMAGFFTPTEAGSVGAIAIIALTVIKRDLNFKMLGRSIKESLRMSCMILMLIAGSAVLGHFVAMAKIPAAVAGWTVGLPVPSWVIMIVIIFVYLLGGSFIDDMAFMILATPIFFPVVLKLGLDPVWFAVIMGVTLMLGVIIPPVAVAVFVVASVTKESMGLVYKGTLPFILAILLGLVLLFLFPSLATWLPNLMMGSGGL
jgi:tripartite ATP-independent transporter DctM subunit